ncbi:MAG: hypothetical protein NUK65_07520 [Firmicutes bacterium]|nr:hypothetical protein [Bacillota bacterium]
MSEKIPWNRQEIFYDDVANYPLYDFFPLEAAESEEEENQDELNIFYQ